MRALAALVAVAVLTAACSSGEPGATPPPSTSSKPPSKFDHWTPIPLPPTPPPTGTFSADMEQSSRDSALNRFQVWVDNDTADTVHPSSIVYHDGRYRTALQAQDLRGIPSQSRRGYSIYQPSRPACGSTAKHGTVTMRYTSRHGAPQTVTFDVYDETDVAGRYAASRCFELAVFRVARLSWADTVPAQPPGGVGSTGTLTLQVRPTGRPGPTLVVDSVRGTPVLTGADGDWTPGTTVTGTSPDQDVALPVKPTRCDAHAFGESGGATAFMLNLTLDGKPGQLILRMSDAGAAAAYAFGEESCGPLT
jgi:hypothetical protein